MDLRKVTSIEFHPYGNSMVPCFRIDTDVSGGDLWIQGVGDGTVIIDVTRKCLEIKTKGFKSWKSKCPDSQGPVPQ